MSQSLASMRETKEVNRTRWNFKFQRKLNRLADLDCAFRGLIVQEALEIEHENGWRRLDDQLLACLARRTELNSLQVRNAFECVFYGVYRIVLSEGLMSVTRIYMWEKWEQNEPGCRVEVIANVEW